MTELSKQSVKEAVAARIGARNASEKRFRWFGIAMVTAAIIACAILLLSIIFQSLPAFTEHRLVLNLAIDAQKADPSGTRNPDEIRANGDFSGLVIDNLVARFPAAEMDGGVDSLIEMISPLATTDLGKQISKNPQLIGKNINTSLALNDELDLYFKGGFGKNLYGKIDVLSATKLASGEWDITLKPGQTIKYDGPKAGALDGQKPSLLLFANGSAYKATQLAPNRITATQLVASKDGIALAPNAKIETLSIKSPEEGRPIADTMVAYGQILKDTGLIKSRFNTTLFTKADSNEPEMAGLLSAIVGSLFTLLITFVITVPVGIMAAVFLEEFAPKNFWTDFIEVNINNLAAVPSIVFGLLGFSVFLHFFNMPRSAPLVGGIVLALMAMPVIIIASRAALKAVPPSIREAALGVGASKVQAVFHHVLPLATPGMMTGSILAMAHALGETAPLLMIGMVAFIADVPKGITDSATVLPVEIFMWAGRPERSWDARTSAAIVVLLLFMVLMNIVAIILRKRFERRW